MGVFDRPVVGVDGTDFGFEALHQTLALSPAGAEVRAVTALDSGFAVHAGFEMSHVQAELGEEAERARAQAEAIMDGRENCTAVIVKGDVRSVLRGACRKHEATLLALGGRNSSRFLGIVVGETATAFLHEGTFSILLARVQWGQIWQPHRIVVGVDGSEPSLAALGVADDLALRLGADVEVETAIGGKLVEPNGSWAARVGTSDPRHPVVALLDRSLGADLIIVGSRGLHGIRALGSVSERVAHRAICSCLVIHH
jgi:nucleotide-binding universal stress UspA family protein